MDLVENLPDVVFSLDIAGNITSVNRAGKAMFGYEPRDVIGKRFAQWVSPEEQSNAMAAFQQAIEGQAIMAFESVAVDKDGKRHNIEVSSTPIVKEDIIVGIRGVVRDITERKEAEDALRESEQEYRTLVETIPHGIQEIDTSGVITFGNAAYAAMMGYERPEIIGKHIWDLLADDSQKEVLKPYRSGYRLYLGTNRRNRTKTGRRCTAGK
jgi:PAS domain S-box-containing protein